MKKERIIKILTHPYFIGLLISALIIGITMPDIAKYRIVIVDTFHFSSNIDLFFEDLDGDNQSEKISIDRSETQMKIMLYKGAQLLEQYNLRTQPIPGIYYFACDYNKDGYKELFFFTRNNDSILLSILDPIAKEDYILYERLIFFNDTVHYELDRPEIKFTGFIDSDNDQYLEIIFSITSGYSKRPRSVYSYDICSDKLLTSPISGATIYSCRFADLSYDSIPEIIVNTSATGNYSMDYPFRDNSSWLMVLNRQLDFYFPPVQFHGYPSSLISLPYYYKDSTYVITLHEYFGVENLKSGLYLFNSSGILLRSRELDINEHNNYFLATNDEEFAQNVYLINKKEHEASLIESDLSLEKGEKLPALYKVNPFASLDVESDGRTEHIFLGEKYGTAVIFRSDFRHPVTIDLNQEKYPDRILTYHRNGKTLLYEEFERIEYLLEYKNNLLYYAKFPIAVVLYLLMSLLISAIYRIQHYRAERQYQTRRKISELQILSLKNQIDPHFTFNILNSLGHLYTDSSLKEKAYDIFVRYSRLIKNVVENSNMISINLHEEMEFVRSYIELEQLRGDKSFSYTLEVDEAVDLNIPLPRMLIYTFVENAIKHGIRQRQTNEGGELKLIISTEKDYYEITILDNGPGLNIQSKSHGATTGRGLHIIKEIVDLYNTLHGVRIKYDTDLDQISENSQKWTRTIIKVPR